MLLARHGLSVLAVDRGRYGSDIMSTHSIAGAGILQLSRWGVLDAVRDAATPVTTHVVFDYGGDRVEIDVPVRGDVDGLYNPRRTVLDPILVDAAVAAGAEVLHGVSMVEVTFDDTGRADGAVLDLGGEFRRVGARFVVGADGARSRVATQVGAELLHRETCGAASIYAYVSGFSDDTILNYYSPGRVVGVIPTNDGAAVVWTGMPADAFAVRARKDVAGAYHAAVSTVPEVAEHVARGPISGLRAFAGTPGFLRRAWGPGWALVGDAGYFKDPVSAHGITDALIGAELVADAIAACLAGDTEHEALGSMQETRDTLAAEMMPAVAGAAALPSDMSDLKRAFRDMSRAMRHEWELIDSRFRVPVLA